MSFKDVSVVLAHGAWGRWVELVLDDRPAEDLSGRRRRGTRSDAGADRGSSEPNTGHTTYGRDWSGEQRRRRWA
jgi:hypothetical protein